MIRFLGCARSDQQCPTAVPNRAMDELGPTDLRPDRVRPDRLRPLPRPPTQAKTELGPTDSGPYRVGPNHWTALRQTAQNFALFFSLSRPQFRSFFLSLGGLFLSFFSLWGVVSCLFFSLWGSSRVLLSLTGGRFVEFGGVFEGVDPQMCTFGLSGCRVKPRRPAAGAPLFSGFGPTLRGSTPNRAKIGRA